MDNPQLKIDGHDAWEFTGPPSMPTCSPATGEFVPGRKYVTIHSVYYCSSQRGTMMSLGTESNATLVPAMLRMWLGVQGRQRLMQKAFAEIACITDDYPRSPAMRQIEDAIEPFVTVSDNGGH